MGMDSYLELFTTAYGWSLSNLIFGLLVDTGIVFVPLAATIIAVWSQAHVDGTENGGPMWAIRKLEIELYCAIFVMAMAFVPTSLASLDRARLTYTPDATPLEPAPVQITGGASGTTYDTAFGAPAGAVDVPVWWYAVMSVSSGITNAVRAGVAGGYLGLRQAEQTAQLATIPDAALRAEAQRFASECWTVARGMFYSGQIPMSGVATAVRADALYGPNDTEWIGSKIFVTDPAYYADIRAQSPVPGFALDFAADDKDAAPGTVGDSRPNCQRWWTEGGTGLRERLINSGPDKGANVFWGIASSAASGLTNSGALTLDYAKDQVLRQALWNTHSNFADTDKVLGGDNASRWGLPAAFSGLGIFAESPKASFSYYAVTQFLIMVQPLVLMALYIFMPLITVFSRYSLQFMIYGALAIFTVKFWAAMWAIAKFIDERLVAAMYGDSTILLRELFTNGLDGGAKRAVLNVLTLGLFMTLPLVWSGMMTWVGFHVGSAVNGMLSRAAGAGESAGKRGLGFAKNAADMAGETVGGAKYKSLRRLWR